MKFSELTLSDYLVNRLLELDVKYIFSITGGGIMHLVDSIARNEKMVFAAVHNECFAGAAADSYARTLNSLGVALGTTGPGLANLFTSVVAAYQDSSPVLFIGGQVKSADSSRINGLKVRQNGTFEFDSIECFKPVTKYCSIVESFEDGIEKIEEALNAIFDGKIGPALLEIPLDVQGHKRSKRQIDEILKDIKLFKRQEIFKINTAVKSCIEQLKNYSRPLLVLGNGVNRIVDKTELENFIINNNLPYVTTSLSKDLQSLNNETFLGAVGLRGNRSANIATQEADALLVIGTSLHQSVVGWEPEKFNKEAYKIWCEIDETLTSLRAESLLVDDVFNVTCEEVCASVRGVTLTVNQAWKQYCNYLKNNFQKHIIRNQLNNSYYEYLEVLDRHRDKFSAITTDAGLATYVVPQVFNFDQGQKFISSGSLGSMGMAVPFGLGAYLGLKTKQCDPYVLIITGDGSLMACLQEIASLKQNYFSGILVIVNNNGYRSIKTTHDKFFNGLKIGTDESNGVFFPNFSDIAKAFSVDFLLFNNATDLDTCLGSNQCEKFQIFELSSDENQTIEPAVLSVLNDDGKFETPDLGTMQPHTDYIPYERFTISD